MTNWTSLAARKSRVTAAVCALALSRWSSRPQAPVRGRHLQHAWKILGKQWLTYQSAVTVFLSSNGMVAAWLNLQKKQTVWKHLCLFRISQVGSHLGRLTTSTVASFRGRIGIPRCRLLLRCPKREETFLRQNFPCMRVHQSTLPRSSLRLWGTQWVQRFLTPRLL